MRIKSQKDFFSGLMFAAIGTAFAGGATHYNVGVGARMGPGYFPLLLGVLWGGLPSIGLPAMGLVLAIYALTLIASLASEEFNLKEVVVLATLLNAGSYLAFVVVLKLQLQVWPSFIAG